MTWFEIDTWGFYVYRAESDQFSSASVIAYRPGSGHGRTEGGWYSHKDTSIAPDSTYFYWLVEEDMVGQRTTYGPVEVRTLPKMDHRAYISFVQLPIMAGVTTRDPDD